MSSSLFSERKQDEKIIGFSPRPSPWSIESRSFGEVSCGMGLFGGSVGLLLGSIILFFFACLLEAASDEAAALLSFKRSSIETDPKGSLHSWGTGSPCSWSGIICTGAGERVSGLNLSYLGLVGRLRLDDLFAIHGLKEINLRGNSLNGNLSHAMAASCAFESVDLSGNNFTGRVAGSFLGHCNRLVFLNISGNSISDGVFPLSPSLQTLDMSRNNFSGDFSGFQFETCGNLTALDLSHNGIFGGVPARLGNCSRLNRLTLSHNRFSNGLFSFLGSMPSLTHLSISSNQLSGEIPPELAGICPTLIELYLSGNNLSGRLPAGFSSCTALEVLDIGRNQLSGDFIGLILGALPNLRILRLPFNNISGVLPILSMKRSIQLAEIDLSSNEFSGEIPAGLCLAFPSLRKLMLPNNFLSGRLPADLGNCTNLTALDLSFNGLSGPVPAEIWSLPELVDLAIWANKISGHISGELCSKGAALETLILNHNDIYGTIPPSIANCRRLVWLSLSGNRLAGNIPPAIGNLPSLAILQLGNNSLTGEIPSSIGRSRNLVWVDLSLNNITGAIPSSLASSSGLVFPGAVTGKDFAFLRNEGEGSSCAGAGVIFEFAGIRPERLASFPLVHACSATRIYTGTAVYTFTGNGTMIYLDLSFNSLAGFIPENIGAMNYLQVLNLGHNLLSGRIPDSFGGLKAIGVLDLSHNRLVGAIPPALGSLSFLVDLDVSNNNFSGEIPPAGQLMTFSPSRFANNSGLCGVPLPPCAPRQSSGDRLSYPSARDRRRGFSAGMLIGVAISIFSLFLLALALTLRRLRKKKAAPGKSENTQNRHLSPSGSSSWKLSGSMEPLSINIATFEKPLRKLTFAQLLEATNGFSQGTLIGSGGFGEVYRARLDDGGIVAVKKLVHVTDQGDREFVAEMETLGKIKHRNLVPLLGYCKVGEERLLVYDYMKHGSLETILHERRGKLDWQARKKIAVGSARGLAFLHHSCIPHIIHRDMKSSNVLLDDNLEARVSDFGMARLVSALDTHLSVSTLAGTPGYVPPEYYQSFRCTTKGDVYSYGVLLLELLTGRRPTGQNEFGENNNLVGWAKQMIEERRSGEIFDPELRRDAAAAAELEQYLKIACRCLDERPMRRPTMIQVMAMYKDQQVDSDSDMLDGFSLGSSAVSDSAENLSAP